MSSTGSSFVIEVLIPSHVQVGGNRLSREEFFNWIWSQFGEQGLMGVHEGTLLSEDAHDQGLETESFTIDSAMAPRERDWIGGQKLVQTDLYFATLSEAEKAGAALARIPELTLKPVCERPHEDWNAQWRESFCGIDVPPNWSVVPPWEDKKPNSRRKMLRINPGAGFGTGTHETTQLCLTLMGEMENAGFRLEGKHVLDFGSGSGILAIGAALFGAVVDAVEIDPLAVDNALENARLNEISSGLRYVQSLSELGDRQYDLIFANILKPVVLQFCQELCARLSEQNPGVIILSGLMAPDVPDVIKSYQARLPSHQPEIREQGEWRAIRFVPR